MTRAWRRPSIHFGSIRHTHFLILKLGRQWWPTDLTPILILTKTRVPTRLPIRGNGPLAGTYQRGKPAPRWLAPSSTGNLSRESLASHACESGTSAARGAGSAVKWPLSERMNSEAKSTPFLCGVRNIQGLYTARNQFPRNRRHSTDELAGGNVEVGAEGEPGNAEKRPWSTHSRT